MADPTRKIARLNKVYIVSAGCYSDWRICGIFSTREGAQKWLDDIAPDTEAYSRADYNDIEEWPVDAELSDGMRVYKLVSRDESVEVAEVWDGRDRPADGEVSRRLSRKLYGALPSPSWRLEVTVRARDRHHAIKIAGDKFREFVATKRVS